MNLNPKWALWIMGLATLILFPLLAYPILYFQEISLMSLFKISSEQVYLIPIFIAVGILFGLIVIWFTELNYFENALAPIKSRLDQFKITTLVAFFLSICAGFGEEVFFRGALQPLIGNIPTALFFVAIHGYFSIKNLRLNFFGILLTFFIIFLGWAAKEYNLWLAISAHFSYDLVLLFYYKSQKNESID